MLFILCVQIDLLCGISYARFPPKRVNQFEWNFEGVYSSLSAFVRDMYRILFLCPPPKYFSHWSYMTLWGIVPLPVQGRNRKSKIAPCSRACWTLYTLQVSFKSTVQFRRRRGINLKKNGILNLDSFIWLLGVWIETYSFRQGQKVWRKAERSRKHS